MSIIEISNLEYTMERALVEIERAQRSVGYNNRIECTTALKKAHEILTEAVPPDPNPKFNSICICQTGNIYHAHYPEYPHSCARGCGCRTFREHANQNQRLMV